MAGYDQVGGSANPSGYAARIFSRENLRGVGEFLGTGEQQAFSLLLNPTALLDRIRCNCTYFYLNYVGMTALLFVLNVFFSPSAWIGMLLLGVMWVAVVNNVKDENQLKMATGGMTLFSAFALWYLLGGHFKWTCYLSGGLSCAHALFRNAANLQNQQTYTDPMIMQTDAGFYQGPQIVGA